MRYRVLCSTLALALVAMACAQNTGGQSTGPGQQAEPASTNTIDVTMQDYAFAIEGEPSAGPLLVNFDNVGEQVHHAIIGKLDEGKTLEDVKKAVATDTQGPPPPWFDDSPPDFAIISPGQTGGIALDAEEGTYVMICFMPDPKGKPHVEHGMVQTFDVGPSEDATEIAADTEVSMTEDGADIAQLSAGESVLSVTNDGKDAGDVWVAQFAQGKTLKDVDPWFGKGQPDPAPITFYAGTHELKPGDSVTFKVNLEPGDYQLVSTFYKGGKSNDVVTDFTVSG